MEPRTLVRAVRELAAARHRLAACEAELAERRAADPERALLALREEVSELFLTRGDDEVFGEVLRVLLRALDSPYGVFGYLDEAGALVVPSLTRDAWDRCRLPGKTIAFPPERWAGVWATALLEGVPVVVDQPLPVPAGHVPLERVVAAPIRFRGDVIGLVMVANAAQPYGEAAARQLTAIADAISPVLHARVARDRAEACRLAAERAQREAVERERNLLRSVIDATSDLISWKSPDGAWLDGNEAFARHVGRPLTEVVGRRAEDLFPAAEAARRAAHDAATLAAGGERRCEEWLDQPDGSRAALDTLQTPLRSPDGELFGLLSVSRDVTEHKRLERRLRQARLRAEAATRAKVSFLTNMSHELRTPLNAVLGFAQILRDDFYGPLTAEQTEYVDEILTAGRRLLDLVTEVLDLARLDSDRVALRADTVPLAPLLERALSLVREKAMKHAVSLELSVAPDVRDRVLRVDPVRLKQVLYELLANAVRATPDGGAVRLAVDPAPGGAVRIAVTDTGRGLTAGELERVFEPFYQPEPPARRIVALSGGRLHAESAGPGRGSRFWFTLPPSDAPLDDELDDGPPPGTAAHVIAALEQLERDADTGRHPFLLCVVRLDEPLSPRQAAQASQTLSLGLAAEDVVGVEPDAVFVLSRSAGVGEARARIIASISATLLSFGWRGTWAARYADHTYTTDELIGLVLDPRTPTAGHGNGPGGGEGA